MSEGTREFRVETDAEPPLVRVYGDVDIDTCDQLAAAVTTFLEGRPGEPLVLELEHVTFLDSSGLAVLAGVLNAGHAVTLRHPSRVVRTIVEATGLSDLITLEP